MFELSANELRAGTLRPPVSKSDAQRAMILARILRNPRFAPVAVDLHAPTDVRVLDGGLRALDGPAPRIIDCQDGGAPFRFLLGQAAIGEGEVEFHGTERLGARPHRALFEALEETLGPAGLRVQRGSPWPVRVRGTSATGRPLFRISSAESSQFASSLLLCCAALHLRERRDWAVELLGPTASSGYWALTHRWLLRAGFRAQLEANGCRITGWSEPPAAVVPADWSSVGYLLLLSWCSGGEVREVSLEAEHPDRIVLDHLQSVGLNVEAQGMTLRVTGEPHSGLRASAADSPDLIPTLAALACVLPAPSEFQQVEILRAKESDRLAGIRRLVEAVGGTTELTGAVLRVSPPSRRPARFELDSGGDHRMAMAAATLACLLGATLRLTRPQCVSKSFPGFFSQLTRVGVSVRELHLA